MEDQMECKKYDINDMDMITNILINETEENEINYYNKILKFIESFFFSDNYDKSSLNNGTNEEIEIGKMKITFTTSLNQENNTDNNKTSIKLGYCEILLRNSYNISNDKLLYMIKLHINQEGMKILKIEYRI